MKNIYVSTVGRGKEQQESSKVYRLDHDSGKLQAFVRLPLAMMDLANPRGGTRGARGLTFCGGLLFCAGWDHIAGMDPDDLFVHTCHWSRNCQDIHQIQGVQNLILATSALSDELFHFHPDEGRFTPFLDVVDMLSIDRQGQTANVTHLNSVSWPYVLLPTIGIIADLERREIVIQNQVLLRNSHDVRLMKDGRFACNISGEYVTMLFDRDTGREETIYQAPPRQSESNPIAREHWMRGMHYDPRCDRLYLGSAPAKVVVVGNVTTEPQVERVIEISDRVIESVFDVLVT